MNINHHFQHDSYNSTEANPVVRKVTLDHKPNQFKAPLPQSFHLPTRQLIMWNLAHSSPVIQQKPRRASEATQQQHQLLNKTLYPYLPLSSTQPLPPSNALDSPQQIYRVEPDEDPMQHLVLLPLGKTGAGKSSLLNILLGYDEFKAKAGAKSVTDCITERTGTWTIDKEAIVTVADTPGFADSMQRDAEFLKTFQDYILDLGSRIGIDAFLLVFQCDSPTNSIMAILDHFDSMMSSLQKIITKGWWPHVMLVFTRVDYYPNLKFPPNILLKKQAITQQLIPEIQSKYNLAQPPKYAFVSSKAPNCSYNKKGHCDCFAAQKYHLDQMRTLKSRVNAILQENGGRWTPSSLRL